MAGVSWNQFNGAAGFVSAIMPESNSVGLYGSVTTDITAVKIVDPVTGEDRLRPESLRARRPAQGRPERQQEHGDRSAATSARRSRRPAARASGVTIGVAGSFTITYIRQLTDHWAVGVPLRMLWLSGAGPNGTGVWNPGRRRSA